MIEPAVEKRGARESGREKPGEWLRAVGAPLRRVAPAPSRGYVEPSRRVASFAFASGFGSVGAGVRRHRSRVRQRKAREPREFTVE